MAQKYLVRCKDASQTAGTGTLTLDNSTSANWQTPVQAVARTLLANGDTVRYTISDTSNPVLYEEGIGTIGSAGLTLTRDTVRQSSSGTSKISWPSGGARDVVISWSPGDTALVSNQGSDYTAATFATNLGLPRLAAANTFVDGQVVSGTSGVTTALSLANLATGAIGNRLLYRYLMKDDAGNTDVYARIEARAEGVTSGAEEGVIDFYVITGGSVARRLILTGSGLLDNSSNKYVAFPTGGTVKMLFSSVPPTGWTRVNETNQAIIRLAQSADTPNASGGSDSFFDGGWATAGHTLIESEIPAHVHDVRITGSSGGTDRGLQSNGVGVSTPGANTQSTGGGGSHAHNMTTPFYRIACWATFD